MKLDPKYQHQAYFDPKGQWQYVLPEEEIDYFGDPGEGWIKIGSAGADGIDFLINEKDENPDVYAHYPIENKNVKIAENITDLIEKWQNNQISV